MAVEVDSNTIALQIFEADIKCHEAKSGEKHCTNCFIFPLIKKTGECAEAVCAAEKYVVDKMRNRQNQK